MCRRTAGIWRSCLSGSLTGYDNVDANSGQRDEEVYEFDAATGLLVCASCDPTGARPDGLHSEGRDQEKTATAGRGFAGVVGRAVAGRVLRPGGAQSAGENRSDEVSALPVTRSLSLNTGQLFFNSSDALVVSGRERDRGRV